MTILFQQNYHFIAFFFVAFVGREGVCKNEYVFYACGNDEKNGQPLSNQKNKELLMLKDVVVIIIIIIITTLF